MKELIAEEKVYLEKYDVYVEPVLTYGQIQAIADVVTKRDTWAEREQAIDELLIHFCTDISDEDAKTLNHDNMVKSGFIRDIRWAVLNLDDIYTASRFEESITKQLKQLLDAMKKMPEFSKKMDEVKNLAKGEK